MLIADPSPARATGIDAIRAVVSGATSRAIPRPNRSVVGRTSTRKSTGGTRLEAELGVAAQAVLVDGIREIHRRPVAMRSGPATMNGRAPWRPARRPAGVERIVRSRLDGIPIMPEASGV